MLLVWVVVRVNCFFMNGALTRVFNHHRFFRQNQTELSSTPLFSIDQKNSWYFKQNQYYFLSLLWNFTRVKLLVPLTKFMVNGLINSISDNPRIHYKEIEHVFKFVLLRVSFSYITLHFFSVKYFFITMFIQWCTFIL